MNKNIVTTLIAGTFFAASLVAPAFATDDAASPVEITGQAPRPPQLTKFDRLPSLEQITERLKNLDVAAILDRDDIREKLPKSIKLPNPPDLERLPELEPIVVPKTVEFPKPATLPPVGPTESPEVPAAPAPVNEQPVEQASPTRPPVKDIVAGAKAEKARILAAHGGDRRAAKAELKAAQMRMVEQIKANNGARGGKGKSKH